MGWSAKDRFQLGVVFIATLGAFHFGYNLAELNSVVASLKCDVEDQTETWPICLELNDTHVAALQGFFPLGGVLSSMIVPFQSRKIGPHTILKWNNILFIIGCLLKGLATSSGGAFAMILIGRFVSGVAVATTMVLVPPYVISLNPTPSRISVFLGMLQVNLIIGLLMASVFSLIIGVDGWRYIIGVVPGVLAIFGFMLGWWLILESPLKMLERGCDREQVMQALKRMREPHCEEAYTKLQNQVSTSSSAQENDTASDTKADTPSEKAPSQMTEIYGGPAKSLLYRVMDILRYLLITNKQSRNSILVSAALTAELQLSGINVVYSYSYGLLAGVWSDMTVQGAIIGITLLNLIVTSIAAVFWIERYGRKSCVMVSMLVMILFHFLFRELAGAGKPVETLLMLGGLVFGFSIGLGSVPFIVMAELGPPFGRSTNEDASDEPDTTDVPSGSTSLSLSNGKASKDNSVLATPIDLSDRVTMPVISAVQPAPSHPALAHVSFAVIYAGNFCNWTAQFVVLFGFPALTAALGARAFLVFGGLTVAAAATMLVYMPETKGRERGEIWSEMARRPCFKW